MFVEAPGIHTERNGLGNETGLYTYSRFPRIFAVTCCGKIPHAAPTVFCSIQFQEIEFHFIVGKHEGMFSDSDVNMKESLVWSDKKN